MRAWAEISDCGRYRFLLGRRWGSDGPGACWVMLNPSTADAEIDDPTIRRCVGFSRAWGYTGLVVVNLFAWRATDPGDLVRADDPVGPGNDQWIRDAVSDAAMVVAAWGNPPKPGRLYRRGRTVEGLIKASGRIIHHLGLTKDGHPRHPLYVRGDTSLQEFPETRP